MEERSQQRHGSEEELISTNKDAILQFLDRLRARAERNELLQVMVAYEDYSGYATQWSASPDKYGITGYVIAACMHRLKFDE